MGIFKAYDVRGIYPSELNEDIAYKIGKAFVEFLKVKEVVVGRDMRLSSDKLFEALAKGIVDSGADVIDIGMCGTSMLYFAATKRKSAIMITASHNPREYNGLKFCRENAIPISYETGIADIEKLVAKGKFSKPKKKGKVIRIDIVNDYIESVLNFARNIRKFKVVVDAGNGMAGLTIPLITEKIGIEIVPLFFDIDGSFPNHEANPLKPENLVALQRAVKEEKADLGVAFDGDGDRIVFVDDKGEAVGGDIMTAVIGKELLKTNPNSTIIYDLRSSWVVKEEIEKNKGIAVETRVGHSFIKQLMRDKNAIFAGELSGHYYFRDTGFTDNGDVAFIITLNLLSDEKKRFSDIIKPLKRYFASGEINSEVKDKDRIMKEVEEKYKEGAERVYHLDGLSIEYKDWHFNLRPSNTEPLLRLNLEAKSKKLMEEKKKELLEFIRKE